jgi:hypothetical protein
MLSPGRPSTCGLILMMALGCATSATTRERAALPEMPAGPPPRATQPYDTLLARVKRGDASVDYLQFRLAFAESPHYFPYELNTTTRKAMQTAQASGDFDRALAVADSLLAKSFVDIQAHMVAAAAHWAHGDRTRSAFHSDIARRLLESIKGYASGTSPESAILVINLDEEYMLLLTEGYRPMGVQGLVSCAGNPCDQLTGVNADGKKRSFYFNVAILHRYFERQSTKDSTVTKP